MHQIWAILQHDGPDYLGLWPGAAASQKVYDAEGRPVFKRNYQPRGAWGDFGEEASPFFLNGKLYHMQVKNTAFPCVSTAFVPKNTAYPCGPDGHGQDAGGRQPRHPLLLLHLGCKDRREDYLPGELEQVCAFSSAFVTTSCPTATILKVCVRRRSAQRS